MLADDKTRAAHFLSAEKKNDDGEKKSDDGAGARAHAVFLGLLASPDWFTREKAVFCLTRLIDQRPARDKKLGLRAEDREGAEYVSHGSTGKGNDQVRFELCYLAMAPDVECVTLWRDRAYLDKFQGRLDLIDYAEEQNIPVERYLQRLTLVADTVRPKSEQEKHDLETVAKWIRTMCTSSGKGIADIFKEWDADSDGFIDYEEFIQCCIQFQDGLEEEADYTYTEEDFEEIAKVIDTAKAGRINYLAFLGLFQVLSEEGDGKARAHMANQAVIEHICSTIWANEVLLSKAFRLFDPQQTGLLAPADFHSALASLNEVLSRDDEAPITSKQIDELVNALPLDAKGKVNYKEFMNAFEVVDLAVEV